MNNRRSLLAVGASLLLTGTLVVAACSQQSGADAEDTSTPNTGTVGIAVDETFAPIMQAEVDTFAKLYPEAHVKLRSASEEQVMLDLLNDEVKVAVVSRELNDSEKSLFAKQTIVPTTTRVGIDGLAIIIHPSNPDSLLTVAQLRSIFTGKTTTWPQLSGQRKLSTINVVFDANRSSTTRFIRDSVTRNEPLTARVFAAKSNPALLEYVATHPNAIGVVGVNWVSDQDDPTAMKLRQGIRVASITSRPNPSPDDYIQPYQVYLAEKSPALLAEHPELQNYPLRRSLYVISREARAGLGTGFASFVAGKNGQLIFQKSGLLPAQMQARIVTTSKP
jgi:phosphate transport system substrate-binding protein